MVDAQTQIGKAMIEIYRTLARYNSWMNRKLFELAWDLDDNERRRDLNGYFRSIHGTLNHVLVADSIWLRRFAAHSKEFKVLSEFLDQPSLMDLNQDLFAEFRNLRDERYRVDNLIERFVGEELQAQHLEETLHYHNLKGLKVSKPLWLTLTHFFNHQTHHRGQATTLFHQIGVDFGVTDLAAMPLS